MGKKMRCRICGLSMPRAGGFELVGRSLLCKQHWERFKRRSVEVGEEAARREIDEEVRGK
jgi:hypothetical protein